MNDIRNWLSASLEVVSVWLVQIKQLPIWAPLLLGGIAGLVIGSAAYYRDLTAGWSGLIIGGIIGVIVAFVLQVFSSGIDEVSTRMPLNKVLGPLARKPVTIYLAPFERPLESELRRINPGTLFPSTSSVTGTRLVVGAGDTVALTYIYAALLKAGKNPADILINQTPSNDAGRWGINIIAIGAANAKTMEVLRAFENTFYTFDDDYSSITRHPMDFGKVAPITRNDGTIIQRRYRKKVRLADNNDFGLILKLKDQARDEGNRIFIVAGLGSDGTSGAAFFLWRHYEELARLADTFGVLVQTTAGHESAKIVDFDKVAIQTAIYE